METIIEFSYVVVFAIVAILFTIAPVIISRLIAPRTIGDKTFTTYECGIQPFGSAWTRHTIVYYTYALIFIAFDVDILYLFPVALSYTKGSNIKEFYSLLAFVLILVLAIIYAWGKGVFTWKRKNL
ncbi:MAG TPA: NADH-quinone oxidoreductase subunit A [Syntrophorhabdaceae bacterium]|nr:NADH-quinone oxidoreductase subunit A [Syntrophorhabdaceae bacterium]HOL05295.1 NADH-quinone oxidoreductase subunit A [Syntrophorhabdaceae bacterium]HON85734.1 NADH-quinone oxidoreductase subunit A [Syntrophorhabdaceae bacterium]HOT42092.1 NADH-quinone oxidoreductase subunit A [Syntrophorhabdaceae bacterium]HPC66037.1 NADH-quinone oxidoreductase subunit A [Syntrophorhabdaceae bacterium]